MQREIMTTADGSVTIAIPAMQVTYHSKHGAIQESMHVFIEAGLRPLLHMYDTLEVFEMGFGTGLNALLTLMEAEARQQQINYHTVEAYPLETTMVASLNYTAQLQAAAPSALQAHFEQLHSSAWHQTMSVTPNFTFTKYQTSLLSLQAEEVLQQKFHLIYYDAFAPAAQPLLWTVEAFTQLYHMLREGGILVTYCSKGDVRRAMQAAGFTVEKIPGPPGKREMVRAKRTAGI